MKSGECVLLRKKVFFYIHGAPPTNDEPPQRSMHSSTEKFQNSDFVCIRLNAAQGAPEKGHERPRPVCPGLREVVNCPSRLEVYNR